MILKKKKNLGTLPTTIAPPTAEELLHSISWLENEKNQIEFIQVMSSFLTWFQILYNVLFSKSKYYGGAYIDCIVMAVLVSALKEGIQPLLCMKDGAYPPQIYHTYSLNIKFIF